MNAGKEGMSQGVKAYERILTRLIERYRKDNGLEKDQPLATEDVVVLQQQYCKRLANTPPRFFQLAAWCPPVFGGHH
ncbi:hypothetical protein, partial [Pseudomonas aeruginosa]|uniref:hypothetical protein n=1 Tax=Pseudomonas aeruginosa TaxID=287 RepID=UPI0015C50E9D